MKFKVGDKVKLDTSSSVVKDFLHRRGHDGFNEIGEIEEVYEASCSINFPVGVTWSCSNSILILNDFISNNDKHFRRRSILSKLSIE